MIETQVKKLRDFCHQYGSTFTESLRNGGTLVCVDDVEIGSDWNRQKAKVLFVTPPGYPAAQPDCFWVEPSGLRLANGATPQASNDSNPIPGDTKTNRQTTWFSWHVQSWNPNTDTLRDYFKVILNRFNKLQ